LECHGQDGKNAKITLVARSATGVVADVRCAIETAANGDRLIDGDYQAAIG
jgi:hypothetical protein